MCLDASDPVVLHPILSVDLSHAIAYLRFHAFRKDQERNQGLNETGNGSLNALPPCCKEPDLVKVVDGVRRLIVEMIVHLISKSLEKRIGFRRSRRTNPLLEWSQTDPICSYSNGNIQCLLVSG